MCAHVGNLVKQKYWDVPIIIPHDDAYAILSLFPSSKVIPILRVHFVTAASSYNGLEAVVSLIVDHSVNPDPKWGNMLSILIQAGVVDHFIAVATLPPLGNPHPSYTIVEDAKRDALVGILWCFEQMLAKDIACVGWEVIAALVRLESSAVESFPTQWQAGECLKRWDRCVLQVSHCELRLNRC